MKMINIRLNPDDERRAEALQKSGVTVSEVVRRAIREEYERRVGTPRPADWAAKLVADVIRRHPTKTRAAVASTDVEGARTYIRARLSRKRR